MRAPRVKVPPFVAVAALLALGACGGDAESAADDESLPVLPVAEEPAAPEAPAPDPVEVVQAPAGEPAPLAEPAAPAEAAAPRPTPPREAAPRPAPAPRRPTPRPAVPAAPEEAVQPEAAPEPEPAPPTVAAGTRVDLRLVGELSTERNAVGDAFEATVAEDVLAGDGLVLVPAGTAVRGRVIESRESTGRDDPAALGLVVDALVLHGRTVPVRATVLDVEVEAGTRDSDARTAAKVGAGAAAGAVVGRILGKDTRSAVKGAVVGAVAGGAVAAVTRDGHAVARDGARILLRIDQALVVDR